jgi:small-conductance mechanosensitive channel
MAGLAVALRLMELESRLAAETLLLCEMESRSQDVSDELYKLRLTLLTEKAAWIELRARFAREDLTEQLDKVAREERTYKRLLDEAKLDLDAAARRLADTRQRRDRSAEADQALVEEVEAARLAREARQLEVTLFGERLQRLVLVKQFWTSRFRTLNRRAPKKELKAWQAEANAAREQLDLAYRLQTDEISELRNSRVTLQEKLASAKEAGPGATRWIREQIRREQEQIGFYESSIASIEAARRLCDKLLAEIGAETETVSFGERLAGWCEKVLAVWRYELTSVEDRPITVSKICIGLLLLFVGIFATRFITKLLGRRVLPRFGLNEGAAAAVQSLLFYLLVLTVALLALRIINVPLTAFTIVGGALAIGVGFGSQNTVNNFISGLILLMERPIRVSDLIEVEDLLGTVEHIGPRATRVRSPNNVDIIVPNSSFLERNVINWTLSDDRYRTQVSVGIAYGSPTRDAAKLIRKAVIEHGKVLKNPKPIVLFTEFGDDALNFEVHFWVRMRRVMDRRIVESDIRYRIDSLFREAGIVIAFPQRDVHLDAVKPLDVRVVPEPQPSSSSTT